MRSIPRTTSSETAHAASVTVQSVSPDSTAHGLSHSQAVLDALADASTYVQYERRHCVSKPAWDAGYFGCLAMAHHNEGAAVEYVWYAAYNAAHRAFCTFPALREAK